MLFCVIAATLTLGACLAVLLPLIGGIKGGPAAADHDLEVYRDQLAELGSDVARGLIQSAEAEEARTEIGRRILRLAAAEPSAETKRSTRVTQFVATVAVLAIPLVSWGLYGKLGSPALPSQPLAARFANSPTNSSVDALIARAEAHLAANPADGKGWDVLAPVYLRLQRFPAAVTAYRNAIRLNGSSAARQTGLGEAIANAAGGIVSADAQAAFQAALTLDPANAKASFYLAMGLAQEGKRAQATAVWQKMLETLPPDSPWLGAVQQALGQAAEPSVAAEAPVNGPDAQQMEAARQMPQQDRQAMIETMVAGLDSRLKQNPRDLQGWMQLIRSYAVLGMPVQARDALSRAVAAFGTGSDEAKKFTAFAVSLGVTATE